MKKLFFLLFFPITTGIYSQVALSELITGKRNSHITVQIEKTKMFTVGFINNIRANIWRDLMDRFNHTADIRWFVFEDEVRVHFIGDSQNVMVRYKKDGEHISTRKVYKGNKLNPLVANFINKEIEKCFAINLVTELTEGDNIMYEICLQDEKHWCLLQLFQNNEREVLEIIDKKILKRG